MLRCSFSLFDSRAESDQGSSDPPPVERHPDSNPQSTAAIIHETGTSDRPGGDIPETRDP